MGVIQGFRVHNKFYQLPRTDIKQHVPSAQEYLFLPDFILLDFYKNEPDDEQTLNSAD